MNKKGVISSYTTALGDADINVADMSNKSRGEYAYALLDIDSPITDEAIAKIEANPNVIKVRVIK